MSIQLTSNDIAIAYKVLKHKRQGTIYHKDFMNSAEEYGLLGEFKFQEFHLVNELGEFRTLEKWIIRYVGEYPTVEGDFKRFLPDNIQKTKLDRLNFRMVDVQNMLKEIRKNHLDWEALTEETISENIKKCDSPVLRLMLDDMQRDQNNAVLLTEKRWMYGNAVDWDMTVMMPEQETEFKEFSEKLK